MYIFPDGDRSGYPEKASSLRWTHEGRSSDIIAYKVIRPKKKPVTVSKRKKVNK